MIKIGTATPIIRIFDVEKAKEFYLEYLGFSIDWEHRFEPELPLYCQIHRGDCVLHLSEHHGDGSPGIVVRIPTSDINALHAELSRKGYRMLRPGIENTDWNTREVCLRDPFGNRIVFSEAVPSTPSS